MLTLNRYSIIILIIGLLSLFIGIIALTGWHTQNPTLIQLHPAFVPILYNTALSCVLLGFGYISFAFSFKRIARICALLAFLIGFMSALEIIFQINLIFFINPFITPQTPIPGRLPPNVSLCIMLVSLALWLISAPKKVLHKAFIISILLSITVALSLVAIWGYVAGIELSYGWGVFTRMPIQAAIIFLLLGGGLWLYVNSLAKRNNKQFLLWFPIHLALVMIIITICLWQALLVQENIYLAQLSNTEAKHIKMIIQDEIKEIQKTLIRLVQARQNKGPINREIVYELKAYFGEEPGLIDIIQFDSDLKEQNEPTAYMSQMPTLKKALKAELDKQNPKSTQLNGGVFPQNKELIFWVPLYQNSFEGVMVKIFNAKELFDSILKNILEDSYNVEVLNGKQILYSNTLSTPPQLGYSPVNFDLFDFQGEIKVWPTSTLFHTQTTYLPLITLLGGLLIASIASLTSYFFQLTKMRKINLEKTLNKLYASTRENEIILNSMNEGILGLSSNGSIDFTNQAALQLLGYENSQQLIGKKIPLILSFPNVPAQFEGVFDRKDGSPLAVEYSTTVIKKENGSERYIIVFRDITKQQEARKEAQKTQNLFKVVIDNASPLIYVKDLSFSYLIVNKAMLELYNLKEEDVIGKNDYDFFRKPVADKFRKHDQKIFLSKESLKIEEIIPISPEEERTYISVKFPLFDDNGKVYALCGISTDITDTKAGEVKLKEYLKQVELANKELEKVNQELTFSRQAAEKASHTKSSFLVNISHEIRTLLNVIIDRTSLLLKTNLAEQQIDYLSQVHKSGKLLNGLVNDVLDYSLLEISGLKLEATLTNINKIVQGIADFFHIQAEEKGLKLLVETDSSFPQVLTDPFRLQQVLTNLISNAIKFTDKGQVLLKVSTLKETDLTLTLRFEITDSGSGISQENQKFLFDKFFQIEATTRKKSQGKGLGLVISKYIIELMDGTIGCISKEGKGSTFWFEISFPKQSHEEWDITSLATKKKLLQAKSFLIVDDSIKGLFLESYMKNWDVNYQSCSSQEEALKILQKSQNENQKIDFVLINSDLQNLNAMELINRIKTNPAYQSIEVILICSPELKEKFNSNELKHYSILTTPIYPLDLFYLIIHHL